MSGQALAASADGTANATIIAPIGISATVTLEFGNIVAAAGTVTIATTGTRTDSVGALTPGTQTGTVRAGEFAVTGQGSMTYSITLPGNSDVVLTTGDGSGATKQIPVSDFTSDPSGTGTLSSGAQTLKVGAKLTVEATDIAGAYTDTYPVIVAYN